jgi:predicted Zn-dependent protease
MTLSATTALAQRVLGFAKHPEFLQVVIYSTWGVDIHWGRNRVTTATDGRMTSVEITRLGRNGTGQVVTDQLDDASLDAAVRTAERFRRMLPDDPNDAPMPWVPQPYADPPIWSRPTIAIDTATCGSIARAAIETTQRSGLVGAGYLAAQASALALFGRAGLAAYNRRTSAELSTTVRDEVRHASGWAGHSSWDWGRIDPAAIAATAVDIAIRARDPVAIEPGRYTTILQPQAVADFLGLLINPSTLFRELAESGRGPFAAGPNMSKLGQQIADTRVTIGQDPMRDLGTRPFDWQGDAIRAVNWIEGGRLMALGYGREYALESLNDPWGCPVAEGFSMTGGTSTIDEMIASTTRGVLVTRLSNLLVLDRTSVLATGVTRDGIWLIERGTITKAIKNFRFTESPVFVLNNIEQIGPAVQVFKPGDPVTVPALKVRDFSFTSLSESI